MLIKKYVFKILKLMILIGTVSYYFAMFFRIIMELERDIFDTPTAQAEGYDFDSDCDDAAGFFASCYETKDKSVYENTLILYYYAFTTLTTVGLGDYAPKSNIERVIISAAMLFGVAVFSYIMGNFVEVLNDFKNFDADLDQGDELSKFIGVLKKFNGGRDIDISF